MKKLVYLFTAMMLMIGVLAGCSNVQTADNFNPKDFAKEISKILDEEVSVDQFVKDGLLGTEIVTESQISFKVITNQSDQLVAIMISGSETTADIGLQAFLNATDILTDTQAEELKSFSEWTFNENTSGDTIYCYEYDEEYDYAEYIIVPSVELYQSLENSGQTF